MEPIVLVLPVLLPLLLASLAEEAASNFHRRFRAMAMGDLLDLSRSEYRLEVSVRVRLEIGTDESLKAIHVDLAPSRDADPDKGELDIELVLARSPTHMATRIRQAVTEFWLKRQARRRAEEAGREFAHLTPEKLQEVIDQTREAATDCFRHSYRFSEWTSHEVALEEQRLREGEPNIDRMAAVKRAKPLLVRLGREIAGSWRWWEAASPSQRQANTSWLPDTLSDEARIVIACRRHLRDEEETLARCQAEISALRKLVGTDELP